MEGNYKAADQLCLGCLCTPTENKIHDYKIQYDHFRDIFEVSTIKLCYLCKRIAQRAEIFIQNVQSNQILLHNCFGNLQTSIKDARSQLQPSIILSHTSLDPTTYYILHENVEMNLESTDIKYKTKESVSCNKAQTSTNEENSLSEMRNEDTIVMNRKNIKVELEEEQVLDHLDERIGGLVDENEKNKKIIKVELEEEQVLDHLDERIGGLVDENEKNKKIIKVELEEEQVLDHLDERIGGLVDENEKNKKNIKVELEEEQVVDHLDERIGGLVDENEKNKKIIKVELEEEQVLDHLDERIGGLVDENEKNKKIIKVELKVETDLDHSDGGFANENDECESPLIKEEDSVKVEAMKVKKLQPFKKINIINKKGKNLKKVVSKTKEIEQIEAQGIKKIFISKEQCMEERKQKALNELYLNCAYKCVDCLKGFNYKAAYDNHMKKHSEEMGEFECKICKIRMDSRKKILRHQVCHKKRFQCTECGIVRTSRPTLLDHYNVIHNKGEKRFACPYCPKSFKRQVSQRIHIRYTHQNKERVTCAFCQKSYANKEVIKTHIMTQHPKEVAATEPAKKYPCKECGMMFRTRTYLKQHSSKHSLSRDYYCVECNKAFKSERLLKQHLKRAQAHVNYSDLPLCCDQCEKRFAKKRHLDRHMNSVHLEVKPFKCDKCDKAYGSKSSLTDHKRQTHGGYKPTLRLSCSFCDKTFCRKTIKAHIRTHTGERPYQCDKCPSKFSQSGSLSTHKKLVHQRLTRDGRPKQNAPPPHKDI